MQRLVKLIMNSLYGVQIRKDINQSYKCKSQHWMETEYDENVLDYWKLPNGNYIVKIQKGRWIRRRKRRKKYIAKSFRSFYIK